MTPHGFTNQSWRICDAKPTWIVGVIAVDVTGKVHRFQKKKIAPITAAAPTAGHSHFGVLEIFTAPKVTGLLEIPEEAAELLCRLLGVASPPMLFAFLGRTAENDKHQTQRGHGDERDNDVFNPASALLRRDFLRSRALLCSG